MLSHIFPSFTPFRMPDIHPKGISPPPRVLFIGLSKLFLFREEKQSSLFLSHAILATQLTFHWLKRKGFFQGIVNLQLKYFSAVARMFAMLVTSFGFLILFYLVKPRKKKSDISHIIKHLPTQISKGKYCEKNQFYNWSIQIGVSSQKTMMYNMSKIWSTTKFL